MTRKELNTLTKADLIEMLKRTNAPADVIKDAESMKVKDLRNILWQTIKKTEKPKTKKAEADLPSAESKMSPEEVAKKVAEEVAGTVIPVKPNGYGVKKGRTRVFAIYNGRHGYRVKTNKINQATELLNEYDTGITSKVTSDGRDLLIDFPTTVPQDTTIDYLINLGSQEFVRKTKKAETATAAETVAK